MGRHNLIDVYLTVVVKDECGKITYRHRQKSRTWVSNLIKILQASFANATISVTNTTGTTVNIANTTGIGSVLSLNAPAGNDSYGLLFGTGTTAYDRNQYSLASKLPNSQCSYSAVSIGSVTDTGTYLQFTVGRACQNVSGGDLYPAEYALVAYGNGNYVLLLRDVFTPAPLVPAGSNISATYTIRFKYA